jgi:hypothetical protein
MTMSAKLLVGMLGLLAVAASPAAVAAETHHVRTHHSQIAHVAPPVLSGQGGYGHRPNNGWQCGSPNLPNYDPVCAHFFYDGFQHDRQMVGVGYN